MFNLAKGILVVDPIEVRGIRTKNRPAEIYLLFQINTVVNRSKVISTNRNYLKWNEDSQGRFDIGPSENKPILTIYLMEKTHLIPIIIDKCEVDLIDIFILKNVDKWVQFKKLGLLNLEFTFYELAPMIPIKGEAQIQGELVEIEEIKVETKKLDKISAADQVFDETKEEMSKFRSLIKRVKRRYKSVDYSNGYSNSNNNSHSHRSSFDFNPLKTEIEVVQKQEIVPLPPRKDTLESLDSIDLNNLPFSADDIGGNFSLKNEKIKIIQKKEISNKLNYKRLTPEEYKLAMRLEQGIIRPEDFKIDSGASEYNGDGTWNKSCLRDSYRVMGVAPKLPPRIPIGMTNEEYYIINRDKLQTI